MKGTRPREEKHWRWQQQETSPASAGSGWSRAPSACGRISEARWWPTRSTPAWSGRCRTTPPTTSRSWTCGVTCWSGPPPSPIRPAEATRSTSRSRQGQERRERGAAVPRLPDRGASGPHSAGLGRDGRLVRGGRGGLHAPARSLHPCRHIVATSRRVRVELDGVVLAESTNSRVLFETGLPSRWYIPKTDVRMDLLVPTETATHCPYKARPSTGRSVWVTASSRTSPGPTGHRCPRVRRSPGWSPSTTSGRPVHRRRAAGTAGHEVQQARRARSAVPAFVRRATRAAARGRIEGG